MVRQGGRCLEGEIRFLFQDFFQVGEVQKKIAQQNLNLFFFGDFLRIFGSHGMKVTIKRTTIWESMYVLVHFSEPASWPSFRKSEELVAMVVGEKNLGWLGHIGDENYPLIWVL